MATNKLRNMYHRLGTMYQVLFFPAYCYLCNRPFVPTRQTRIHPSINTVCSTSNTFSCSVGVLHRKKKSRKKRAEGADTGSRVDRIQALVQYYPNEQHRSYQLPDPLYNGPICRLTSAHSEPSARNMALHIPS